MLQHLFKDRLMHVGYSVGQYTSAGVGVVSHLKFQSFSLFIFLSPAMSLRSDCDRLPFRS